MILGFLGSGKMATALAQGVVRCGVVPGTDIVVSDVVPGAAATLAGSVGGRAASNEQVCAAADAIVLCVKPGDAAGALHALSDALAGKLVISIAAGMRIEALEKAAGSRARIIRVMPNTPALVGHGAAAYALGSGATPEDGCLAEKLFGSVGTVSQVKESLLDVVTGLSGSGPAFVYLFIEALADGAVLMGLPRDQALQMAAQTVAGSAEMILRTGQHPAALRDQVASPGGTTIAGIEALEEGGARAAIIAAVRAATERSMELGKLS